MIVAALAVNVTQVPGRTLEDWTIRMKHVDYADYSGGEGWEAADWTVVYQQDETFSKTGLVWFEFDTPFVYDGEANLLVDFSYTTVLRTPRTCLTECTFVGEPRTLHGVSDSDNGDPLGWSGSSPAPSTENYIVNIRLMSAAEVGLVPGSVEMTGGSWTGSVTITSPTEEVYLSATSGSKSVIGASNSFEVLPFIRNSGRSGPERRRRGGRSGHYSRQLGRERPRRRYLPGRHLGRRVG